MASVTEPPNVSLHFILTNLKCNSHVWLAVAVLDRTAPERAEFMPLWNLSGLLMGHSGSHPLGALGAWTELQKLRGEGGRSRITLHTCE